MKWFANSHIAVIYYLAIAAVIFTVCNATDENIIERNADDTIPSDNSDSLLTLTRDGAINVDLYYAALCTDAMRFVRTQLVPVYEQLSEYLTVTYIPYGKGTHDQMILDDGSYVWNFTCQFGIQGCYGNKAHTCAINEILTNSAITNEQQLLTRFLGCAMSSSNPSLAVPLCLTLFELSTTQIASVNDCIDSHDGDDLLASNGDKTYAVQGGPLDFVPTIVINEEFSQENQDRALVDFKGLICEYIPAEDRPVVCSGSISLHAARNLIAIIMVSLVFFVGRGQNYLY